MCANLAHKITNKVKVLEVQSGSFNPYPAGTASDLSLPLVYSQASLHIHAARPGSTLLAANLQVLT